MAMSASFGRRYRLDIGIKVNNLRHGQRLIALIKKSHRLRHSWRGGRFSVPTNWQFVSATTTTSCTPRQRPLRFFISWYRARGGLFVSPLGGLGMSSLNLCRFFSFFFFSSPSLRPETKRFLRQPMSKQHPAIKPHPDIGFTQFISAWNLCFPYFHNFECFQRLRDKMDAPRLPANMWREIKQKSNTNGCVGDGNGNDLVNTFAVLHINNWSRPRPADHTGNQTPIAHCLPHFISCTSEETNKTIDNQWDK